MQDLIKKIKKLKIDEELDLNTDDILTILNSCNGCIITALHYAFKAGYLQGSRAELIKFRSHN